MGTADLIPRLRSTAGMLARQGNHEARDLMNEAADALETKLNRVADSDRELIKKLLAIAEIGIVNANNDAPVILDAADRIEELSERVAIMAEGSTVTIEPGADVDLWPSLERISQVESQITMDEMLKGDAP